MMLARRIKRDIKERGRDIDGILDQVSLLALGQNLADDSVPPFRQEQL
jgi:uridine kinase